MGILEKTLKCTGLWAHRLIHLASSGIIYPIFDSEEDRLRLTAQKVGQEGQKVVRSGPTPLKNSEKSGFYSLK